MIVVRVAEVSLFQAEAPVFGLRQVPEGSTVADLAGSKTLVEINGAAAAPVDEVASRLLAHGDELVVAAVPAGGDLGSLPGIGDFLQGISDYFSGNSVSSDGRNTYGYDNNPAQAFGYDASERFTLYKGWQAFENWLYPSFPSARRFRGNAAYDFNGASALYGVAGLPIPRLYGRLRVGVLVVAQDVYVVETISGPETHLRLLGVVSAGPIQSIGGYATDFDDVEGSLLPATLEIAGNDANSYEGVRAWGRLGSLTQSSIPGFDVVRTVHSVGLDLQQGDGTNANPVLDDWTYGESFTMDANTVGDRARVTIGFPNGLLSGLDGLSKHKFEFQIGLTRVDEVTGDPLTERLVLPSPTTSYTISEKVNTNFNRQVVVPFYDPDTFVLGEAEGALGFVSGAKEYGYIPQVALDAVTSVAGFADGGEPAAFTYFGVFQYGSAGANKALFSWGDWNEDLNDPAVEGFVIETEAVGGGLGEVVVWAGPNILDSADTVAIRGGELVTGFWHSIALVYRKVDPQTGTARLDLYVDGAPVGTKFMAAGNVVPIITGASGSGPLWCVFPKKLTAGTGQWHSTFALDEQVFYHEALSSTRVAELHAAGAWSTREADPSVLFGLKCNAAPIVAQQETPVDYGIVRDEVPIAAHMLLFPGNAVDEVDGVVLSAETGAILRGRYKIEVQRTNKDHPAVLVKDEAQFAQVVIELDEDVAYPGCALLGLDIIATNQLSGSSPNVTVVAEGLRCDRWTGDSETDPSFVREFSRTAAWQLLDVLKSKAGGLGRHFSVPDVVLPDLLEWAAFTDELVYDMRGKVAISQVSFEGSGASTVAVLRTSDSVPTHWIVGGAVRLAPMPAAFPLQAWETEITALVDVGGGVTDVKVAWPNGGPKNLVDEPNDIGTGSWVWVGTAGTLDVEDSATYLPVSLPAGFQVLNVLTFPSLGKIRLLIPMVEGVLYQVGIDVAVADGGGDAIIRFELGQTIVAVPVPGDGKVHRITTAVVDAGGVTTAFGLRSGQATPRTLAIGCAFCTPAQDELVPYDEQPPAGTITPANLVSSPSATDEALGAAVDWTAIPAGSGLSLAEKDAEPLPDGIPGKAEKWVWDDAGDVLRANGLALSGGSSHYLAVYFKSVDLRSAATFRFTLGSAAASGFKATEFNAWKRLAHLATPASGSTLAIELGPAAGQRVVLIGAVFVAVSTKALPYDDGTLGEVYGAEPRLPTDIYFGDRSYGAWDAVLQLMGAARAAPYRTGSRLGARVTREKPVEAIFGPWNIVAGTFRLNTVNRDSNPNSLSGEIRNADLNYDLDPVTRDHPSLQPGDLASAEDLFRTSSDMRGITDKSVAIRELDARLVLQQDVLWVVNFAALRESLSVQPGAVFAVVHPLMSWGVGAKAHEASPSADRILSDTPVLARSPNCVVGTADLTAPPWEAAGASSAEEPVVTDVTGSILPPAGLPADTPVFRVDFPGSSPTNSRLQQAFANRGAADYVQSLWMRAVTGTVDTLLLQLTSPGGVGSVTPSLDTDWLRVVNGPHEIDVDEAANPEHFYRLQQSPADATARSVYVCAPRLVVASADDGRSGVGLELTDSSEAGRLWATWRDGDTGELHWIETYLRAGLIPEGGTVLFLGNLPKLPQPGDAWTLGPLSTGKRFVCVETTLSADLQRTVVGREYVEDLIPDPADYELIEVTPTPTSTASALSSPNGMPASPVSIAVLEDNSVDPDTGAVERAIVVSWQADPETAALVHEWSVWGRDRTEGTDGVESGSDGRFEHIATVRAGQRSVRIASSTFRARRGNRVELVVQPVSQAGLRPGLGRCVRRTLTLAGYWPTPDEPAAARVSLTGDLAVYEVEPPTVGTRAMPVEIVRGGIFLHQKVGRVPAGARSLGPTEDWSALPAVTAGPARPRLLVRAATGDDARGHWIEATDEIDVSSWPAATAESSVEDDWTGEGALDGDLTTRARWDGVTVLEFGAGKTATTAYWTGNAVDLGAYTRWHLSLGVDGQQVHPRIFDDEIDDWPALDDVRGLRWSAEGPIDPGDVDYGAASVEIQIKTGDGATPDSDWRPARPGFVALRSFQLRLKITRPDATWNVVVDRLAYAARRQRRPFDPGLVTS